VQTEKETENQMYCGLGVDFEVVLRADAGGPAFRCGLPSEGKGVPIRDAGLCADSPALFVAGTQIQVDWPPDVSWRKRIRFSNRR
jgi:hypothetical protein